MDRLLPEDIFSPIRFDTSLADSSVNSGESITSTSNIEREMCLSFQDAPYEKCVFEISDEKPVGKNNELASNMDSFKKTIKPEKYQVYRKDEIISKQGTLPGPVETVDLVEGIFSPVRFDTSFADSTINSEGSISSASNIEREMCLSFKDVAYEKCEFEFPDVKSFERKNEMGSNIISFENTTKSENPVVSDLPFTPKKDSSMNLVDSKKLTSDIKILDIDKRTSKRENVFVNENNKIIRNQNEKIDTKQSSAKDSLKINDGKFEKPARPTSLLSTKNKMVESNSSRDIKKKENKIIAKSTSSKNATDQNFVHKRESDSSVKNYLDRNIPSGVKTISTQKADVSSVKQVASKNRIKDDLEKNKSKKLQEHARDLKATPDPSLQSENEMIEKMVYDIVSFECSKIRQNMYSDQMSIYREINKLKDEMQQNHLVTTERLFKSIKEQMHINMLLKETL